MPPPIREMRAIFFLRSGRVRSKAATLVRGPVGTMVTGSSLSSMTFSMRAGALRPQGSKSGSGSTGPSRPLLPWTVGTTMGSATKGLGRPTPKGAWLPMRVQILRAL